MGRYTGALSYYGPADADRGPEVFHQTLVAVTPDQTATVMGFGNVAIDDEHPAHVMLSLNVPPAYQGRGVG